MNSWIKSVFRYEKPEPFILGEAPQEQGRSTKKTKPGAFTPPPERLFEPSDRIELAKKSLETVFFKDKNDDLAMREFETSGRKAFVAYIEGLTDKTVLYESVLAPLMHRGCESLYDAIEHVITIQEVKTSTLGSDAVKALLEGQVIMVFDGERSFAMLEARKLEKRSVGTPENEKVLRGAHQGFIEDLRTNISLVRNLARTSDLCTQFVPLGGSNHLRCAMMYREGVVNEKLLSEVKAHLEKLDEYKGFAMGDGMLTRFFSQRKFSLIPQVLQTERPDRTAAFLMQGHIALICEGIPFATIVPITFLALVTTSEDANVKPQSALLARYIRMISLALTVLLPGLYVSLMTFHQVVLPTELLISTLTLRKMVGMPVVVEVILMSILFEMLREATVRVQGGINQSLGVVGGIVLGDALISANLVSPIVLIVVTLSALCSFTIPDYGLQSATYLLRFGFLALGAMAGLLGIVLGVTVLFGYLTTLNSMGVPFMGPVAPATQQDEGILMPGITLEGTAPDIVNAQGGKS